MTTQRTGLDLLADYVIQTASRNPELLEEKSRRISMEEAASGDHLIVKTAAEAKLSILVAEALLQMSREMHEYGDQADIEIGELTSERALVLVREYGGFRPASRATGIGRMALWRAVNPEAEVV